DCLTSKISPGWQSSALQIASNVEKRIALAFPFFNMETLAIVMPTFSVSSVTLIFLLASITSMLILIAIHLYSEIVLRFDINGILQELLQHCGEDGDHQRSNNKDQSDQRSTRRIIFVC